MNKLLILLITCGIAVSTSLDTHIITTLEGSSWEVLEPTDLSEFVYKERGDLLKISAAEIVPPVNKADDPLSKYVEGKKRFTTHESV